MRAFPLLLLVAACVHTPSMAHDGDQFVLNSRRYPQLSDRGDTTLPARQPLLPCLDSAPTDWVITAPAWPSLGMPVLQVAIPPGWRSIDLAPVARIARQSGASIDSAAHIVGIWQSPTSDASLRLATDTVPGYQLAVVGGKSRQAALEECTLATANLPGRMVIATVEGQSRDIVLVALWRVGERLWLKASARATSATDSLNLRRIIADFRRH